MTCNKGGLDERERVQEIPYRDIWVYFNFVDFLMGGGGGYVCVFDSSLYMVDIQYL